MGICGPFTCFHSPLSFAPWQDTSIREGHAGKTPLIGGLTIAMSVANNHGKSKTQLSWCCSADWSNEHMDRIIRDLIWRYTPGGQKATCRYATCSLQSCRLVVSMLHTHTQKRLKKVLVIYFSLVECKVLHTQKIKAARKIFLTV